MIRNFLKEATFTTFLLIFLLSPSLLFASSNDDIYDAAGLDPHRETLSSIPEEHIDPFTGGLTLNHVDFRLPGNGGLDLVIQRSFNSKNVCNGWTCVGSTCSCDKGENTWLGYGWALHFGRLFKSTNVNIHHFVEMPDGSRQTAYLKSGSSFITKDYSLLDLNSSYVLTLTNGTKIYYGQNGPSLPNYPQHSVYYANKIQDVNGNEINIYYTAAGSNEIDYVIDSDGRRIEFTTSTINSSKRLTSISCTNCASGEGVNITYTHQSLVTMFDTLLTKANLPVGNPWEYTYNGPELQSVESPYGGTITYSYDFSDVNACGTTFTYRTVVQKSVGGRDIPAGTWTLSYSQGTNSEYTQVSDPCGRTIKYGYYGYGSNPGTGNMWKLGLPKSKEIVGEETTTYTWTNSASISSDDYVAPYCGTDSYTYVPLLSSQSITRGSKTYTTNYSNYDNYGNPQTISESGDKTRTTSKNYWYNTTKNIVRNKPSSETVSGYFPGSFTTNFAYDSSTGNLTLLNKYGVTTTYSYYSNGNLYSATDANSKITYYQWNNGKISQIRTPEYTINRDNNDNGTIASETNGRNYITYFTYDANLRLKSIDPPAGNTTSYTYASDNSSKQESRGSFVTYYYYEGFGRPSGTSDSKGITTDIVYKNCGLRDYSTSNIGDRVDYDNFGRVDTVLHKDSTDITYSYSGSNVTVNDEAGKNTYLTYNAFGNPDEKLLISVLDPLNNTTSYYYNILGSVTSVTQGSISRSSSYSTKNFLSSETHPEKGTITYGRDNVGNMTSKTDSLGTTNYTYDGVNRLTNINYGTGSISFTYDGAGNRTSMDNPSAVIDYTYDQANRLTGKDETISGRNYSTSYTYDGNDNPTDIYYPTGRHIVYAYNSNNQVTSVTGFGNSISGITYYTSGTTIGLPKSFTYSGGLTSNLTYNNRNLTTQIKAGTSILDMRYDYDTRGNTTSIADYLNNFGDQTFSYDDLNRLSIFNGSWGTGSYTYGSSGNRLSKTVAGASTNYNYSNNRLSSTTGGESFTFSYNSDGDVTTLNGYTLQYNRLHNLTGYNSGSVQFAYDGDGMRITKTSGGNTLVYHYNKEGSVISENDGNGNLIADYVYLNGQLAAKIANVYTVTPSAGTGGTMSPGTPQTVNYNAAASFTVTPNTGYHITAISGCGGTTVGVQPNNASYNYTTGPITADCTVTATFAINTYSVTPSAGTGGTMSPGTPQTVNYNAAASFTVTPNTGYHITAISGCGGTAVGVQPNNASYNYITGPITGNCTVTASFSNTYTVTPSAGSGGIMSPGTPQTITYNATTSFTMTPNTGYHITAISGCGGTAVGVQPYNASYNYTTGPITADCTVTATFAINTFTVTPSAGSGGTISPGTPQTVNYNATASFTVTPNTGYHITAISGCGGTAMGVQPNNASYNYTTRAITADCTVTATFAINNYTVTPSAGTGGSISPSSPQTVIHGSTTAFTVTSSSGYHIASVSGCGGSLSGNTYTTGAITADCTVKATFAIDTFTVTPSAGTGGTMSPGTPQTVNYNATTSFTVTPNTGYHITAISGCGGTAVGVQPNNASYNYTTGTITADCTVTATFAINTYTVTPSAGTGGTMSPGTPQTVNYNAAASFTVTPNTGYHITAISGCGGTAVGVQPNNASYNYTTGLITADCTVTASFSNTYTVIPSAGENGTMSPSAPQTVNYNATTSFAITPDTGYLISSISGCGGTSVGVQPYNASYNYTTGPITGDCTVTASFEIIPASEDFETGDLSKLPWTTGGDGIWGVGSLIKHTGDYAAQSPIVGDNQQSYFEITLNIISEDNIYFWYKVSSAAGDSLMFYVDGVSQDSWSGEVDWTYESYPVNTGQHTLRWEYSKDNSGSSGSDAGWVDNITFPPYELIAHTVTASADSGGAMTPAGLVSVYHGLTTQLTVEPDAGYHITSISGCGGTPIGVQPNNAPYTYSTGPITGDCTVTANFAINTYTVTPSAGVNGTMSPSTPQAVNYNSTTSFTVTPNTNYHVASVSGCSGDLSGNTYTTGPITADCTVTATFALNTYLLTITKSGAGSGTVTSSPAGINCGSSCSAAYNNMTSVTLTASVNTGSIFAGWSGGGCSGTGSCTVTMDSDKTVTANFSKYITVTSPNGGESLPAGSVKTITWTYTGNPGTYVKIELYKGGTLSSTISSFASAGSGGSGSYNWTVPAGQTPGTDYTVKVTSTTNASYTDTSDGNFSIVAPSITLTSPNGGESLPAGIAKTITWTYTGNPGTYVKIELYKGGALSSTISSFASAGSGGNGSYSWTVPSGQTPGTDYTVKVTSITNTSWNDMSDASFEIVAPTITVTSPNGGESLPAGVSKTISWTYTGNPGTYVKIELYKGGALSSTISSFASAGSGGSGSYNWTVPSGQTPGMDYQIKVTSTTNTSWNDMSDQNFTIVK